MKLYYNIYNNFPNFKQLLTLIYFLLFININKLFIYNNNNFIE